MKESTIEINHKLLLFIAGAGVLLSGVAYRYIKKKRKKPQKGEAAFNATTGFCKYSDDFPLRKGSCGEKIKELQKRLLKRGIDLGSSGENNDGVDGKFGELTLNGVKKVSGKSTLTEKAFNGLQIPFRITT